MAKSLFIAAAKTRFSSTAISRKTAAGTDIHTLARQMGTSVGMLERHYRKLLPSLKVKQLAE